MNNIPKGWGSPESDDPWKQKSDDLWAEKSTDAPAAMTEEASWEEIVLSDEKRDEIPVQDETDEAPAMQEDAYDAEEEIFSAPMVPPADVMPEPLPLQKPPEQIPRRTAYPQQTPPPVPPVYSAPPAPKTGMNFAAGLLGAAACIVLLGGGILAGKYFSSERPETRSAENSTASSGAQKTDAASSSAENAAIFDTQMTVHTTTMPAASAEPQTAAPVQTVQTAAPLTLTEQYRAVLQNEYETWAEGYYFDCDHDGTQELIMLNTTDMNFVMYSRGNDGAIRRTPFGYYKSVGEAKLFDVTGTGGNHYFYWRCEYSYTSVQGYYDLPNNKELDIGISYEQEQSTQKWYADWVLFLNNTKFAGSGEYVSTFYGETPQCHAALMNGLAQYGFQITDNSDYKKIPRMTYQELLAQF